MLGGKQERWMPAPDVYWMQFYRQEPGDVGIPDLPIGPTQGVETTTKKALLSYFNNATITPQQKPHHARVVTGDKMTAVLTLMATGAKIVENVPNA